MTRTKKTISAYNTSARQFAERFMDFATYKNKLNDFQRNYLSSSKTILDLGCGPGNIAKLLSEANSTYEITGIDLSEKMIELARNNVPKGEFSICDIREFKFKKSFDAVIASFCIVHLTHTETTAFLNNACSHLKPSGYLYLTFMEGQGSKLETTCFSDKEIFFNYFHRAEIVEILKSKSMSIVQILNESYVETSGEVTRDIFIIAKKADSFESALI